MKRERRLSLRRWVGRDRQQTDAMPDANGQPQASRSPSADAQRMAGASLEKAYRDLLVQNQILSESNARLQEQLADQAGGVAESPAAKQLIRAQRDALVERSRRLREVEYELKQIQRIKDRLVEENLRLQHQLSDFRPVLRREEQNRRELAETKAALREKTNELLCLTDKYFQLEARLRPAAPPGSVANGRF
ncbi:MAG: hypothetical protein WBN68_18375 [Sedimenticolaceae bacterium]